MRPSAVRRWLAAIAVPLLLVVAAGCGGVPGTGGQVSGSGTAVTRQYDDGGFTGLRIEHAFAVTVSRGDAFAVEVTVDDNLVKYLRVELDGDTLHIGMDPDMDYRNATLKADVTMPSLQAMDVSGASSAEVDGFASQDPFELQVSGGGKVHLKDVRAGTVTIEVSGAGRLSGQLDAQEIKGEVSGAGKVSLKGSATKAQLAASGGAELDMSAVTVQDADLEISGGANVMVDVTGTLSVEASGGAHLYYYGTPKVYRVYLSGGAQAERAGL